jgi:hypothetical protein
MTGALERLLQVLKDADGLVALVVVLIIHTVQVTQSVTGAGVTRVMPGVTSQGVGVT